jgi:hypothetical protein
MTFHHEAPMQKDLNPGFPITPHKPASLKKRLLGLGKAWLRDIMIAAEFLHKTQFSAPWRDCQSPHSPNREPSGRSCF